jgi:excisionase family DNA binding protein
MTALTTPPAPLSTPCDPSQKPVQELSQAVTTTRAAEAAPSHSPPTAVRPTVPTPDSLTIGQAAVLTGLHKNTIRAYIKQGRLAAGVVKGKYGQEYRISRGELVELIASVNPLTEDADHQAVTTPPTGASSAAEVGTADALSATQGPVGHGRAE